MPRFGSGRTCFLAIFRPSTSTRSPRTSSTLPRRPLSLPQLTIIWSSFLMRLIAGLLKHFRRQGNNPHIAGAEFAGHGAEYARSHGLALTRQQNGRVPVETNDRSVRAAHALACPHHDGIVDFAFLHPPTGNGILDSDLDHVAHTGVSAVGTAQHLYALHFPRTTVVRGQ